MNSLLLLLSVLLVPAGAVLWYLGGYGYGDDGIPDVGLPKIGKGFRRYVWPAIAGLVVAVNKFILIGLLTAAGLAIANSLGYGETKKWLYRIGVAILLGASAIFIYPTWVWPAATLVTFIPLYRLSLKYNWMTWHVVEAATGATQGACVLTALLLRILGG